MSLTPAVAANPVAAAAFAKFAGEMLAEIVVLSASPLEVTVNLKLLAI